MRTALVLAVLTACGYPAPGRTDAGTGGSRDAGRDGARARTMLDGASSCGAPADYGTVTASSQAANYYPPGNQPGELDMAGVVNAGSDYLMITLTGNSSQIPSNDIPNSGSWPLDSSMNLATCGVCGAVFASATASPIAQTFDFTTMYVATAGTVTYSSTDTNAMATVTNAEFAQATFTDSTNQNDWTTALVSGGCTTKVDSASFNVVVTTVN